ncbi:MAG TPA: superoxide dismutase family protein [Gemmatimonadaceae bacterium]|nr:superoxide dismutase family protein [Gemmatimonadaceae bacterium]
MNVPSESVFLKAFLLGLTAAGCSTGLLSRSPAAAATVNLTSANGTSVGTAQLRQSTDGFVTVDLTVSGLTPGSHGIHFHAVGLCEGSTSFSTAGGHYNPLNKEHGLARPAGPHAGDAPNIVAGSDGRATVSFTTDRVTLTPGATTLFDTDGSALVVHATADDQVSQPAGNSGGRVACGVVRAIP